MSEYKGQLAEIDRQIDNLMDMDTTDAVIASGIGALQEKKARLLNEYGKDFVGAAPATLEKQKKQLQTLKEKREKAKHEVARSFNETAVAVKTLRDTETDIKDAHKNLQASMITLTRSQGKPFQPLPPPAIHYRAIGKRDRLGALDNWYSTFAGHFGKMAIRSNNFISISKERFFDVG